MMNSSLSIPLITFSPILLLLTSLAPLLRHYRILVTDLLFIMSLSRLSTCATYLPYRTMTQPIWIPRPTLYTYKCAQHDQKAPRRRYVLGKLCHKPGETVVPLVVEITSALLPSPVIGTGNLCAILTANTPQFQQSPD